MNNADLIAIDKLCSKYEIEVSFVDTLQECGLIKLVHIEKSYYLPHDHLSDFEKLMRLHYELGINAEGLDVINNLLTKISDMELEIRMLREKFNRR